ncbi:UNVERIFIED_ORG: hypothetical protein BDU10_8964 [Burkholderia sp. CF145]|uniref:hypothetical protein n=1 Tax=Paraburkholderia hospita TaxID=169430 RepID=UPI0002719C77|nr:hypothetical protein [Paraburkholderia hospita]EUC11876.1 hypothetical protein PMI06_001215 [Burkholderia sp. BT03]SKD07368.1 hypothetical protein SAMN06266956_9850 [Paraburkholderia hospita]
MSERETPMMIADLPRDTGKNVDALPDKVAYLFPDGTRIWRRDGRIHHASPLRKGAGRAKTEAEKWLASEMRKPGLKGMERAHTLGRPNPHIDHGWKSRTNDPELAACFGRFDVGQRVRDRAFLARK